MSQPRSIHPGATYLITRRVERRHFLLRPDADMTQLITYAFIVAARRHRIQLHALCAMSTHLHYVISDPRGQLPLFLALFHRLVAIGTKVLRAWDGSVWDHEQTSVVELLTREAVVEKIAYTLANLVEAGLVRHAHEWPGAKTLVDDIGKSALQANRSRSYFSPMNPEWVAEASLDVSLPPMISQEDTDIFRNDVASALAKLEKAAHARIPASAIMGAKRAATISPQGRATSFEPIRKRNPTFAVGHGNTEMSDRAAWAVRAFRSAYRTALDAWRSGIRNIEFPTGTYRMRVFHGANSAPFEHRTSLGTP